MCPLMDERLVDLIVEDDGWNCSLPALDALASRAVEAALREAEFDPERHTLSLLAASDSRIRDLNESFRGKASPTNVLSWPAFDLAPDVPGQYPRNPPDPAQTGRLLLGDVAIALQTCIREAAEASKPLKNHVTHLILHGCLHLLGYDHQTDEDAELMEGIERSAMAKLGLPDPYVQGGPVRRA